MTTDEGYCYVTDQNVLKNLRSYVRMSISRKNSIAA